MRINFPPTELSADELALQAEVREFLREELPPGSYRRGLGMSAGRDKEFSKKLAQRGWVGMALPARYGGGDRSAMDRFIVVEELLRWGAPISHHWVADRQTAAALERFGSDAQKEQFLPAIATGEISFSIGMSEPDSGSDLASVSTRATRVDGGWSVTGRKLWTSGAADADWVTILVRTDAEAKRHAGLTQMLIDLRSPELQISSVAFIDGSRDFYEVVFDEVFVPDDMVLGEVGSGWNQIVSELAFERGGPDRWLSPFSLVEELLRASDGLALSEELVTALGNFTVQWWALRQLSLSVARMIDESKAPSVEAALVKSIGTRFEQSVVSVLAELAEEQLSESPSEALRELWRTAVLSSPSWTIRGGTSEVLVGIINKALQ